MATEWSRDDDADLAAKLAPVLGETAVYETGLVCASGHWEPRRFRSIDGIARCRERVQSDRICDALVTTGTHPVAFSNPAVGWGTWEQWNALEDNRYDYIVLGDTQLIELYLFPHGHNGWGACRTAGSGHTTLEALLLAWRTALTAEVSHAE